MKVFMIGGTGLLGSEAARILLQRGHQVVSLALPPVPEGFAVPGMELDLGNFLTMTDAELLAAMAGCEGFVYAAGVDERVEYPPPVYAQYDKYNIQPVRRLLGLAKQAGVKHAVVLGSYFSYFARLWPHKELTRWHPYIRSRIEQEDVALSFAEEGFDVSVLQLPYIFGAQPGRKPVWVFLVKIIRSMPLATFYPAGGTAMVTVRQVGEAIAGAVERSRGAKLWPIGWHDLTWRQMFTLMHKHLGTPGRKVVTVPRWMFALSARFLMRSQRRHNIEGGLHLVQFTDMMCRELFIDRELGSVPLGVTRDDIDAAIGQSMRASLDSMDKASKSLDMRGE